MMSGKRWLLTLLSFAAAVGASIYVTARTWPAGGGTITLPWTAHALALAAALVLTSAPASAAVAVAPLVVWPLAVQYGVVVAPAPGGGGLVEVAFTAALGSTIPARIFGAALVWWRFYTFYIYILLGALVAGGAVLRALGTSRSQGDEGAGANRALQRSA